MSETLKEQLVENLRLKALADANAVTREEDGEVRSEEEVRKDLEKVHGQVWNTQELQKDFIVHGFAAPFITATRKSDNKEGTLEFTHMPRFYHSFREA